MTISDTRVEILESSHRQYLLEHFMGLSESDRQFRFCSCMKSTVEDYLSKIDFTRDRVLGAWNGDSVLVGVGHLYFLEKHKVAYICLSVDSHFRGLGYGQILIEHAKKITRACCYPKLKILCSNLNTPIISLASKSGFCMVSCKDSEWEGALTF